MDVRLVVLRAQRIRAQRLAQLVQPLGVRLMVGDVNSFAQIRKASLHFVSVDRQELVVAYTAERPVPVAGEFRVSWLTQWVRDKSAGGCSNM